MPSLPGFPIFGKIISGNRRYPVGLRPGTVATITLTRLTGDLDMWLLNYGQRIAQSEQSGLQDERIVYAVESPGQYQIEVRPYGSQPGATFTVDAQAEAVTPDPVLFHAAMITNNSPDMQAYAAKLRNIKGAGAPAAIAVDTYAPAAPTWDADKYDLIIIGHDTSWQYWSPAALAKYATRPLLLIGAGGRSFLYVIKPELTGAIGETVGKIGGPWSEWGNHIYKVPYNLDWKTDEMEFYPDFVTEFAAANGVLTGAIISPILASRWHEFTAFKLGARIGYYGYPTVPNAWEGWGVLCNLATDLAARGKTA